MNHDYKLYVQIGIGCFVFFMVCQIILSLFGIKYPIFIYGVVMLTISLLQAFMSYAESTNIKIINKTKRCKKK